MDYSKNMGIMDSKELKTIQKSKVLVIGVGGLGGFIASSLVRIGVGHITIVDFDVFDESNLNRQIFATSKTIGQLKVDVAKEKLMEINPNVIIKTVNSKFDYDFDLANFYDIDIVFDGVDNIETRLLIEKQCSKLNIPLIHGAIGGWYGQLGIIMPNSTILKEIYKDKTKGIEETLKSPTFLPPIIANMMIGEFVKFLLKKDALVNQILYIDLLDHEYQIIYKK